MKKMFVVLLWFCALNGWAQQPLLTTHWTQEYPYNQHCPADPLENNKHSYAGCPAVVMGQILNYLRTTQGTRFDDGDDYFSDYFGRQFHIDDDWDTYDFPSFPQLNEMMDSVDAIFQRGGELSESLMGAVVFACGVACKQVYSASDSYGSGTFYVDQAFDAYQRFGFENCQLFREPDSAMYAILISNIQAGYPAHLAIENPAGTSGHNVVIDGYRESDGMFHLNFVPSAASMAIHEASLQHSLEVYPNPATDVLRLKNLPFEAVDYAIFNAMGQRVKSGSTSGTISMAELTNGIYLLQIDGDKYHVTAKFVVR